MNDTELDEMLNQWDAPEVPRRLRAELRERVQAGFTAKKSVRRRWLKWPGWHIGKGLFAGAAAGAVLFLLLITQAFPQTVGIFGGFRIPFTIESEVVRYADEGSPANTTYLTSFPDDGNQIILKATNSGTGPLWSMVQGIALSLHTMALRVAPSLVLPNKSPEGIAWHRALVNNGCVRANSTVVGHEIILGHSTTVVRFNSSPKITQWMAPDLECASLKMTIEDPRPDGTFRLTMRSQALKVTMNP